MRSIRELFGLLAGFTASAASLTATAEIQSYETRIGTVEFHNNHGKGESWFAAFRFYGPLKPYYDGSFTLPDIENL